MRHLKKKFPSSSRLKHDLRDFFNKLKQEIDSVAFRTPTVEETSAAFINLEEERAQLEMIMRPMQALPFMKSEIRIECFACIAAFLVLVLYLPVNLSSCFDCDSLLTYWLLSLTLLSTIGLLPDFLVLWKLSNYNQSSEPSHVMGCLYLITKSNVYSYMSSLANIKFFLYLMGTARIWWMSVRKCEGCQLLPICYMLIISFFLRIFYSLLRFKLTFHGESLDEKKGFTSQEIATFQTETYFSIEKRTCSICMEDFGDGELVKKMKCAGKHIFHKVCIDKWLISSRSCPNCRVEMLNKEE